MSNARALVRSIRSSGSSSSVIRQAARNVARGVAKKAVAAVATSAANTATQAARAVGKFVKRKISQSSERSSKKAKSNDVGGASGYRVAKATGAGFKNNRKKGKPVKPSKRFKKLVRATLDPAISVGEFNLRLCSYIGNTGAANNIQRSSGDFKDNLGAVVVSIGAFEARRVLDVASQLFNGKVFNLDFNLTPNNFDPTTTKIHILQSSLSMTFFNNTQVPKEFELYIFKAKTDTNTFPLSDWALRLAADTENAAVPKADVNQYGLVPSKTKSFMHDWGYKVEKLFLDPGCKGTFFVPGPKDAWYDYAKYGVIATNQHPRGVGNPMFYVYRDVQPLQGGTASGVGLYQTSAQGTATRNGVTCLAKWYYKLAAPEETPTGALINQDFDKYIFKFPATGTMGVNDNLQRIDPVEPAVPEGVAAMHGTGTAPIGV